MSAHRRSLAPRRRAAPSPGRAGGGFLTAGLLAALAISPSLNAQTPPAAPAQTPSATTTSLLEQGRYWQARNNDARAAEAWGRLLQADPKNTEALYNLGLLELKANRPARAREYLAQLRALGTAEVDAVRLEQEITLRAGDNPKALEQARLLASSGELDKAVAQYRSVFGGKAPQGRIALEYYGYLGYTNDGWDEARQGLERLQRESPDNVQVSLALAKLLTRKESTRAEGIRRLARLSSRQDVGGDADESWRAALTWYGDPRPAEAPLFEAYLKAHPDDTEIRQQYSRTRKPTRTAAAQPAAVSPQDAQLNRAFKELESGDLTSAEANLSALLQANPNHADALGGMGVLRLKQDRPDEAVEFLTRATRQPRSRGGWQQVLGVARYWSLNASAERAREAGELEKAQQQLEQAVKLSQNDRTAEVALGGVLAERGQYSQAEKIFRGVLARDKDNLAALQGLVNVLAQTDRMEEALRLVSQLSPADQQKLGGVGQLRATQARNDARKASERGDYPAARRLLEDGLRVNPDDAWLRLDLARLYLKTGSIAEARGVVDGLLLTNPDDPGALQASALLSAEVQDWDAALKTLDRIPARNRTKEVIDLQKLAWTQYQVSQAVTLARAGKPEQAKAILAQLEPEVAQSPALIGSLASAYIDAGDNMHALSMLRQAMARTSTPDNDLLLQYTVVLLKTDQDAEAAGILRQLQTQALNDRQTRSFDDLRKLYTVRQADALRQRGRIADAYDVLAPMLAKYPNDPLVVGALARMYSAAGDGAKALALHRQLLEKDPDNAELLTAAAQAAVQARNTDYAEAALAKAVSLHPRNPTVLASVGRVYNSMGKSGKAAEYLKAALAAQAAAKVPAAQQTVAAAPAPRVNDDNPFASLPGQVRSNPPAQRVAGAAPADTTTVSYGGPVFGTQVTAPATYAAAARGDGGRAAAAPAPAALAAPVPAARASSSAEPASVVSSVRADLESATVQAPFVATVSAPPPGTVPPPSPGAIPDPVIGLEPAPTLPPSPFRRPDGSQANLARASAAPAAPKTLEEELDAIQQARSATITVGTTMRQHNGAGGMGRMLDVETPVTVDFPVGDGRAYVQATPVTLRAGSVGGDFASSSQFGGGPAAANAQQQGAVGAPGSQNASGVGVAVGYQLSGLKLDLGVTPFGFRYQNIVGGARFDGEVANEDGPRLSYGVEASRRAVTDTVLSYAGTRDSRTGESWGGVTATGGRLRGGLNYDGYGFYGSLGWHSLNGHNVQSNSRLSGGAGFYMQLIREPNRSLTSGLDLTLFGYDKNLAYYTVGNGGYFSPQRFVALSVPLAWAQRQGRFSYQVKGSIGVQHIKQDAANYFSDPARQAQAEAIAAAYGSQASYAGQSKTGIGYGLALAAEYQLAPKWFLGGNFSIDNARDYRQYKGGIYVRYALEPQTGPVPMPVPPFASPYASE
ncbi:cellulose synthase subunit BcsC-related outer membrane protein [Pigmentiphaga sp. GD03639]|uniref:Cellulose synthase operon C C-terminal domain-containing protein n=1 Tax=Pigmentiphaga daeguensis TaxID=414049 RepID=A0ABP3LXK2_9BURK|nr:cellulose synthase subunit BcsC-related outer membrane protein [Pigmentiphaga sp. GD03639]MDH2236040.1 cellulose synthase subunit BcsC-related outer membrane protein [Pigmentiphaga sp. GD03639]